MHYGSAMVTQFSILEATSPSLKTKTREYGQCCFDLTLEMKHTHCQGSGTVRVRVTAFKLKEQANYSST